MNLETGKRGRFMRGIVAIAGLCALFAPQAAAAETVTSAYTKIKISECAVVEISEEEEWGIWRCEGYGGVSVRVAEGDLRTFVSYDDDAGEQLAATQTFPGFNSTGETLEWRLKDGKPFATILRFYIEHDEAKSQVLVVTQLKPLTCHIGYVDATRNANANELARQVADEMAGSFDCGNDEAAWRGAPGTEALPDQIGD
jgi:hypothetical protein